MTRQRLVVLLGGALLAAGVACGSDDIVNDPRAHLIQITDVKFGPPSVHCGGLSGDYLFLINVHMVNTTADSVSLQSVSSGGTYILASADLMGKPGFVRTSLPFTAISLRANDGDQTTTVSLGGTCPPFAQYGTVLVTLLMHTERGTFATVPFKLSLGF